VFSRGSPFGFGRGFGAPPQVGELVADGGELFGEVVALGAAGGQLLHSDPAGVERAGGNVAGVVGVAITQPSFKSYCAHPAESLRRLVSGEQDQCGLAVREIESPFQGWEILQ
jgi:hypothetical protein